MNIVFIGFASSGKSATAYEVSKALELKFVDLDKEIEIRYFLDNSRELHYRDIIRQEGDELFFQLENRVLQELTHLKDLVIAPGGGAPLREENRQLLAELGQVVYLQCDPAVLLKRMQAKGLPLFLRDNPSLEYLTEVWHARHAIYTELADVTVDNSSLTIKETVDAVLAALQLERK